jgi:hypothetical protein
MEVNDQGLFELSFQRTFSVVMYGAKDFHPGQALQ